jgi:uncharacterized protein YyaL (SSP411 family)
MNTAEKKFTNRLIHEQSPYLLQHAHNPVDWHPWQEEAFEKAKNENKPVFLSVGYATCHWCHVMEKESFENPEVARLMNEAFVSIKVDREERPDIDSVYMKVCQLLTGSGGWPLTIIMTPDKKPFFASTYIPRENRFGRLGMLELIPRLNDLWKKRAEELEDSADKIITILKESAKVTQGTAQTAVRPETWRVRSFSEISSPSQPLISAPLLEEDRRRKGPRNGGEDSSIHAAGRYLRPSGFWIPPLLDRREMAGSPL